jgi:hypothetical protein
MENTFNLKKYLSEGKLHEEQEQSIYYKLGYQFGPNRRLKINPEMPEVKNILNMADTLYNSGVAIKDLESGPALEFTKGYIDSIGSNSSRYNGVQDVIRILLYIREKGLPEYSEYWEGDEYLK